MANIPTQGQSIIVDPPEAVTSNALLQASSAPLVSWIVGKVAPWEDHRDRGYQRMWGEYWRMWRGKWSEEDRTRQSERSHLIAPALAQAIEQTVSELEEALFSKEVWFDIVDNTSPEEKLQALVSRDILLTDLERVNAKDAFSEAILNGALFGTGIIKIVVEPRKDYDAKRDDETGGLVANPTERVYICVESIRPDEFIPDPAGRNVNEMMGCAHRVHKPMHDVLSKIEQKIYRQDALGLLMPQRRMSNVDIDPNDPQSMLTPVDAEEVDVLEYHGKVPLAMLEAAIAPRNSSNPIDQIVADERDPAALVEAIVTIANGSILLRAMANPFAMKDRSIIAFQFEKVPGRFWGRGVAEKGYNPQKALDAEVRARIDALGFVSSPMLGVDAGRIPRGFKMEIKPGKVWLTQGPPGEVLQPVAIGDINSNTFNQASEMERMVQMGTGAFDTATALKNQSQSGANSLSSNSMLMGAFVKRAKRSVANVDRNLLQPAIQKIMWRYMQYAPRRYPQNFEFQVKPTLGIIAREVEAMQMTQLLGMMPEQFGQVSLTLVQGIIEHSTVPNKAQILQQVNQALQPPDEETQQKQKQLQDVQFEAAKAVAQGELLKNQKTIAEIRKILAEAQLAIRKADVADDEIIQEQQRLQLMGQEIDQFEEQNRIAAENLKIKAREVEIKAKQAAKPASK